MWFSFNDGFLSVVADKNDPAKLLVRARRKQDLVNMVGLNADITQTPSRDYRWRAFVSREDFKVLVGKRIDDVDYTNFKNSVKDHDLHKLYLEFWHLHQAYQERGKKSE